MIKQTRKETAITATNHDALQIAMAYYDAWTVGDIDRTMSYIAEDIVCDVPAGRLEGSKAFRKFESDFVQMLIGSKLITAFGDEEIALLLYDIATIPVKSSIVAEYLTVKNGKIISTRIVFDQTPFASYQSGAQARAEAAKNQS